MISTSGPVSHPGLLEKIPAHPGTYVLMLLAEREDTILVGRLGAFAIRPSSYLYVGSAFSPGGLRGRLRHHLALDRPRRWHVDYLRPVVHVEALLYAAHEVRREHEWARLVGSLPGATIPLPRFGASDCHCPSHLFRFASPPDVRRLRPALGARRLDDRVVRYVCCRA